MEITNMVSTTTAFGLCRCKCGIYALVGDPSTVPPTQISCNMVFSKSKMRVRRGPSVSRSLPELPTYLEFDLFKN